MVGRLVVPPSGFEASVVGDDLPLPVNVAARDRVRMKLGKKELRGYVGDVAP